MKRGFFINKPASATPESNSEPDALTGAVLERSQSVESSDDSKKKKCEVEALKAEVAEAKARKKRKDSRRAEKVKAKAEAIAEADDVSAKAKMRAIEKLMKAQKQKKPD